ncbi:MAG: class I SAM-dependent methyltransferase [Pseudomonadota bacterium]
MSDQETIDIYNAQVEDYTKLVRDDKPDQDLRRFIDALPQDAHVLDLGCGPGHSSHMMMQAGLTVRATDASREMVAFAKEKYGVNAHEQVFADLTEVDAYDGVWANFSLLHDERANMPSNLARIKTALKPKGVFNIAMKLGSDAHRDGLGRFYTYYTRDELTGLLDQAGFTILSEREDKTKGMAGQIDPFIILLTHARD